MDKDVWGVIRDAIRSADRSVPKTGRRPIFSDRLIVKIYFCTVAADRPRRAIGDPRTFAGLIRSPRLPSYSQFCKRLHTPRVVAMIERVCSKLARTDRAIHAAYLDGKAMRVGESSKDPDARTGRGDGTFSRGYKIHAFCGDDGRVKGFRVHALNRAEPRVAREELLDEIPPGVVVLADGNYDSKFLYAGVRARGSWMLAPPKRNRRGPLDTLQTGPERLEALRVWENQPGLARAVYTRRWQIERIFAHLTCFGGGLAPLPAWVRRIDRVRLWITAKIAIYNARVEIRERRKIAAS